MRQLQVGKTMNKAVVTLVEQNDEDRRTNKTASLVDESGLTIG